VIILKNSAPGDLCTPFLPLQPPHTTCKVYANTLLCFSKLTLCLGDREWILKAAMVHLFLERFPQISAPILSSYNRGYIDPICTLTNFFGSIGSVFGGKFFGAVTDRHFASLGGVITRLSLATSLHGQIWPFPPSQLSPLLFGSRRSYWLLRKTGSVTHSIRSMRCA